MLKIKDKITIVFVCVAFMQCNPLLAVNIDVSQGTSINQGIRGQNPSVGVSSTLVDKTLSVSNDSAIRGPAGGLCADTYNWKTREGWVVGYYGESTLDFLRDARDAQAEPLFTANMRGIGPTSFSSNFTFTDQSVSTLTTLAKDWVYYTNIMLQIYRLDLNEAIPFSHINNPGVAVSDSRATTILGQLINWSTNPVLSQKLLSWDEAAVPKVIYWEIGNEPEAGATGWVLTTSEYVNRYKTLAQAMKSEDPQIKTGPCTSYNSAWLQAVINDSAAPIDFVSIHPYGTYYDGSDITTIKANLEGIKAGHTATAATLRSQLTSSGRPNVKLMYSEWNNSSYESETQPAEMRQSHALGVVETLFTFAETNIFMANYWPRAVSGSGIEIPSFKAFQALNDYMGAKLVNSVNETGFRMYTTRDDNKGQIAIWGLNFDNSAAVTKNISLTNLGHMVKKIELRTLQNKTGSTTLLTSNDNSGINVDWTVEDKTAEINPSNFDITFDPAEITLVVIYMNPAGCDSFGMVYSEVDFNKDCIVNFKDMSILAKDWMKSN